MKGSELVPISYDGQHASSCSTSLDVSWSNHYNHCSPLGKWPLTLFFMPPSMTSTSESSNVLHTHMFTHNVYSTFCSLSFTKCYKYDISGHGIKARTKDPWAIHTSSNSAVLSVIVIWARDERRWDRVVEDCVYLPQVIGFYYSDWVVGPLQSQ